MLYTKPVTPSSTNRITFFQEFLKHPLQIGSVVPSSRFLERRVLQAADVASARTIIELGPGTGGTTRAILAAMPMDARLLGVEINPHFHALVSGIDDGRLNVHLGSAADLPAIISRYGLDAPDAIISGIPFSTMKPEQASRVLAAIQSSLAPGGHFVAYQFSRRVVDLCQPYMGTEQTSLEWFNIPPMRIYTWEKAAD